MYVCMHASMFVFIYVCMYVWIYVYSARTLALILILILLPILILIITGERLILWDLATRERYVSMEGESSLLALPVQEVKY